MLVIQIQIFKEHMNDPVHPTQANSFSKLFAGGGERIRTDDPLRARQVLSQLSYTPDQRPIPRWCGGPGWS